MIAGIDTHKDTLAVAVIDPAGQVIISTEVANTPDGFRQLTTLLQLHAVDRIGIEGSGCFGRAVAIQLAELDSLEVREVPPTLTARERGTKPGQGKTDTVDAIAIARITAREKNLPQVRLHVGQAADLRALIDYRDQLVDERRLLGNRVHAELSAMRPGYHLQIRHLNQPGQIRAAQALMADDSSVRAGLVRRRLDRIQQLDAELAGMRATITTAVEATGTSLLEIYGVGPLIAARILGEVVDIRRYRTKHAFASCNGTAPLAASSGRTVRHRLNRHGNRKLNRCLYVIALTEVRADTAGRAYYRRKREQGKTGREAMRCLQRRLSDVIYRTLRNDLNTAQTPECSTLTAA